MGTAPSSSFGEWTSSSSSEEEEEEEYYDQHSRHGERQRRRFVCPSRGRAAPFSRGETIQQTARESHLPALSTDRRLLHRVWCDDETTTKDDQNGKSKRRKTWILSVTTPRSSM